MAEKRVCDAHVFDEYHKESLRYPTDARTLKKLHVHSVLFKEATGHFRAWAYDFHDDSSHQGGKVYCVCGWS